MRVRAQLFSHLRDLAAASEIELEMPDGSTLADLLASLYREKPTLRSADKTLLLAAGVEFVDRAYRIQPGDEISIMPPVQGG